MVGRLAGRQMDRQAGGQTVRQTDRNISLKTESLPKNGQQIWLTGLENNKIYCADEIFIILSEKRGRGQAGRYARQVAGKKTDMQEGRLSDRQNEKLLIEPTSIGTLVRRSNCL